MNEKVNIPNNAEIDKALKEFEVKNTEQTQKAPEAVSAVSKKAVEGVQFETDSYKAVKFYKETATPKMIKLVMKLSGGAIKDEKQASYFLLGFVAVAIIISLFLVFGRGSMEQKPSTLFLEQMQQMQQVPANQ